MSTISIATDSVPRRQAEELTVLTFTEELVALNLQAPDSEAVISTLADRLAAIGLVSEEYGRQTIEREHHHPTGLPTSPFCIAFPHADADGVHESALAVALLGSPVAFQNMADPDEVLDVYIVFMLANKSPEEQIQTLRELASLFGQPEKLSELRNQSSAEDVTAWLRRELRLN